MGGLACGLDAVRWSDGHRLARRDSRARCACDVGGRVGRARARRGGAVPGNARWPVDQLLPCGLEREFAIADALRQSFGETGGRILTIGADEFREGGEQASLRQTIAIDAVVARLRPGLVQKAKRCALVFVVPAGIRCKRGLNVSPYPDDGSAPRATDPLLRG